MMILEVSLTNIDLIEFTVAWSERNLKFQIVSIHNRILLIMRTLIICKSEIKVIVEEEIIIFLDPILIISQNPNRVGVHQKKKDQSKKNFLIVI